MSVTERRHDQDPEKVASTTPPKQSPDHSLDVEPNVNQKEPEYYDTSKETPLTRLGLSPESFKKAPGITR